jgi:ABC-type molybdate transport system permease subunit
MVVLALLSLAAGVALAEGDGLACDQERCQQANNSFLVAAAVLDVLLIVIGFLVWRLASARQWLGGPLGRWLILGLAFSVIGLAIIALNPFANDTLKCCMASENSRYLTMAGMAGWIRGLALGAGPVFGGFTALLFASNLMTKR